MHADGKTLTIGKALWAQYGGVEVQAREDALVLSARDEDAYVKVFNHFGRTLKLYVFEGGQWVDTDTGVAAQDFDERQAGRLPDAPSPASAPAPGKATRPTGTAKPRKPSGTSARKRAGGRGKTGRQAG